MEECIGRSVREEEGYSEKERLQIMGINYWDKKESV